jgi:ABC-2 type transport system ATP-binding protein
VDISVPRGAIYGILGPNGAGKTTTLRMLLGIIDPDSGYRRVLGTERPTEVARRIGYLPEERGLYPAMKATEAIAFLAASLLVVSIVGAALARRSSREAGNSARDDQSDEASRAVRAPSR